MAEVTYNQPWNNNQFSAPTQQPVSDPGANSNQPSGNKTLVVVIAIALIFLSIIFSIYLIFFRSATKPVPREVINKALPPGTNPPQ